jgi:hypothetical protein
MQNLQKCGIFTILFPETEQSHLILAPVFVNDVFVARLGFIGCQYIVLHFNEVSRTFRGANAINEAIDFLTIKFEASVKKVISKKML